MLPRELTNSTLQPYLGKFDYFATRDIICSEISFQHENRKQHSSLRSIFELLKSAGPQFVQILEIIKRYTRKEITKDFRPSYIQALKTLIQICIEIDLPISKGIIEHDIERLNRDKDLDIKTEDVLSLWSAIERELRERIFVFIDSKKARYFMNIWEFPNSEIWGKQLCSSFSNANEHARDAGNCFATGNNTACVFHCMQVLEIGLRSLANKLQIRWEDKTWGEIIIKCEEKISSMRSKNLSPHDLLQKYSEVATEFKFFKNAWRNYVSHGKSRYDEREAELILSHVILFMKSLAAIGLSDEELNPK